MSGPAAKETQIAVYGTTTVMLSMPHEEFVEFYSHPIEDDTWIRTEEIVKMENMVETEGGEEIKREILKEHIEERVRTGQVIAPDPILEGMLYQERFMEDYKRSSRKADSAAASSYRRELAEKFRDKHPRPALPPAPFGEEDRDIDEKSDNAAGEYPAEPVEEHPAEPAQEHPAEPAEEYPVESADEHHADITEDAQAEAVPAEEEPQQPHVQDGGEKASPMADSPRAADAVEVSAEAGEVAAAGVHADADTL